MKLYRRYGLMLDDIIFQIGGGSKKDLHKRLKKARGIDSLTNLSKQELYRYLVEIEAFFASECGIEVLGNSKETLTEYLNRENGRTK